MEITELDAAVVGAGTAGMYALSRIRRESKRVKIFDGGSLGTTCARVGCMPSKMLIHGGDIAYAARDYCPQTEIGKDGFAALMSSIRRRRDRLSGAVIKRLETRFEDELMTTDASFAEPMVLKAGGDKYRCRSIVLAAGTTPALPPGWKKQPGLIVTTDEFFELEKIPENILVVGLGFIGVEIGQTLGRMGRKVTGVEMTENIGGITDPKIKEVFLGALKSDLKVRLKTRAELEQIEGKKARVMLRGEEDRSETRSFDLVVVASGRRPPLDRLHLEKSGLRLNEKGFPVFDEKTLKCDGGNVFLAGDFSLLRPFYHPAVAQGKTAGFNAVHSDDLQTVPETVPLSITFTRPYLCGVGKNYRDLPAETIIGEADLSQEGRAVAEEIDYGTIRIYAEGGSGRILGAELAAPGGEHLAHLLAAMIGAKMTVEEALRLPFYHPTYEEGVQSALKKLRKKLENPK